MGIGNLTELTDADSAGINVLLLGFCQELGIRSVLTTQVINWARTVVRECDLARRLVYHAVRSRIPPKHLEPRLVTLRDPKVHRVRPGRARPARRRRSRTTTTASLPKTARSTSSARTCTSPTAIRFCVFERLLHPGFGGAADTHEPPKNVDPSHAFYLGYEMAKAATALDARQGIPPGRGARLGLSDRAGRKPSLAKVGRRNASRRGRMTATIERSPTRVAAGRRAASARPDVEAALVRLAACRTACCSTAPCAIRGWAAIRS